MRIGKEARTEAPIKNAYPVYKNRFDGVFRRYHAKNAVVYLKEDGSRLTLTFGRFKEAVLQIGALLDKIHLRPFDRIAILSMHSPFAVLVNVALSYLGYTAVPLDVSLPSEEICRLLEHAEVSAVFIDERLTDGLAPHMERIPVFEIGQDFTCRLRTSCTHTGTSLADGDPDVAVILFSSGTTGSMKGIQVTYTAILLSASYVVRYANLSDRSSYLDVLPSNHIVGYSVSISCLLRGCEVGFLEDAAPQRLAQGLLSYNPTHFVMIPKVYEVIREKILATIRKKPLPVRLYARSAMYLCGAVRRLTGIKLRFLTRPIWSAALGADMELCGCGAAPCTSETARFYLDLGINFVDVYGSTEACFPITAANCNDRYPASGAGKTNQFPEIQVKIFRPDRDGIGEIHVKTPMIMKGYFKDPELTAASFDGDGFFRTGDLGTIDRQGYLHVTGRIKETILLRTGKKVSPSDIDAYYAKLCGEIRIASCGVSGPDGLDTVHLFIETHGQSPRTIQEARRQIIKRSATAGAIYKVAAIHEIEQIPVTSIGKVKRFLLQKEAEKAVSSPRMAERLSAEDTAGQLSGKSTARQISGKGAAWQLQGNGTARQMPPQDAPCTIDTICQLIGAISDPLCAVTQEARLREDLGMDSLNLFQLCVELEDRSGRSVEPYLWEGMTVGDLAELIGQGKGDAVLSDDIAEQYPQAKTEKDMRAYRIFMEVSKKIWPITVYGKEQLDPDERYIFCPNHESYLDGMWVVGSLDEAYRWDMSALAADYLFEHRIFRRGLIVLGGIPVHRGGNTAPAVKRAYGCLASGRYHLLVHPEGTRSRSGRLGSFKSGAARLSIETGVRIVPVCIHGAYTIFPPHRKLPRLFDWRHLCRYPLTIRFGTPIAPAGKTAAKITEEIRQQIITMKREMTG